MGGNFEGPWADHVSLVINCLCNRVIFLEFYSDASVVSECSDFPDMGNICSQSLRDHNYIVQVDQCKLPLQSCRHDVHDFFERFQGRFGVRKACEWIGIVRDGMRIRFCFSQTSWFLFVTPYYWRLILNNYRFAVRVYALIHLWDRIRFALYYSVRVLEINSGSESSVFSERKCNWRDPFRLSRFNYVLCQLIV